MELFVAEKRAEILRARVAEEERVRAEQGVRAAAVAVAGRACKVMRELVARNERMSRRVAGLQANIKVRVRVVMLPVVVSFAGGSLCVCVFCVVRFLSRFVFCVSRGDPRGGLNTHVPCRAVGSCRKSDVPSVMHCVAWVCSPLRTFLLYVISSPRKAGLGVGGQVPRFFGSAGHAEALHAEIPVASDVKPGPPPFRPLHRPLDLISQASADLHGTPLASTKELRQHELIAASNPLPPNLSLMPPNLQDREERVSQLKEASAQLEANGRCARSETDAVRDQLAAAMEELDAAKKCSQDLEERLGPLEKDCRDAQTAQERLR